MIEPIAIIVTIDDPLIGANAAQDNTQAMPSRPGNGEVTVDMKPIRRLAIEPRDMMLPANMNSGIDNNTSRSTVNQKS